jgi:hypothetical protein
MTTKTARKFKWVAENGVPMAITIAATNGGQTFE